MLEKIPENIWGSVASNSWETRQLRQSFPLKPFPLNLISFYLEGNIYFVFLVCVLIGGLWWRSGIIYAADLHIVTSVRIFCSTWHTDVRRPITASPLISMKGYLAMRVHGIIFPSSVNTHSYMLCKLCCRTGASACAQSLTLRFQPSVCLSSPCLNYCTEIFGFVNFHVTCLRGSWHCFSLV